MLSGPKSILKKRKIEMIIDFHTHSFPDKIAAKAVASLAQKANIPPYRDGTLSSLCESMKKAGVDYSVVLPVATSPKQVESINRLAAELNLKNGIIYAGAIHPDCENIPEILDGIKAAGLFGIKIHPDYQGVYFDDPRYIYIMGEAARRNLITVTHAGLDLGYPDDIHCTPDRVLNVLEKLSGIIDNKLVLAHLGGCDATDEVIEKLCGKPIYMDMSFVTDKFPAEAKRIILAHGADKILFATDSPWSDQAEYVKLMPTLGFDDETLEKILHKNAEMLFGFTDLTF